ncbi:MAG: gephyrin-like molybdotransferase Glp [Candidatus Njordarchaeota archaeon]
MRFVFRFKKLIPIEKAVSLLLENVTQKSEIEYVEVDKAIDRVVGKSLYAKIDVPKFDRARRDGFAVRLEDISLASESRPIVLKISGYSKTGHPYRKSIDRGEAVRIDTGAVVPPRAEAVVPIEYCSEDDSYVRVYKAVSLGENIQWAGSDIRKGELIIQKGTLITLRHVGAMSAVGYVRIPVIKKPRIALFSIGDELVNIGQTLSLGKIYDINIHTIASYIKKLGCEPVCLGIAKDSKEDILQKIQEGIKKSDLIISTGGSSVGQSDFIRSVVEDLNAKILFHGVMSKPGKPVLAARIGNRIYIGLPGNPTSAIISYMLYVEPIVRRMLGIKIMHKEKITTRLYKREFGEKGRRTYKTVIIKQSEKNYVCEFLPGASESITTLSKADGYFVIKEDEDFIDEGTIVDVYVFDGVLQQSDIIVVGFYSPSILRILVDFADRKGLRLKYVSKRNSGALLSIENNIADIAILTNSTNYDVAVKYEVSILGKDNSPKVCSAFMSIPKYTIEHVGSHQSAIFRYIEGYVESIAIPSEFIPLYNLNRSEEKDRWLTNLYIKFNPGFPYKQEVQKEILRKFLSAKVKI